MKALSDTVVIRQLQRERRTCLRGATRCKRQLCLELYSGEGSVTKLLKHMGYACMAFEIKNGDHYNLLSRGLEEFIKEWIRSGLILGVFLGTPCMSWSVACKPALRSVEHIWGLPAPPPHRLHTLITGNRTFRLSIRIVKLCNSFT